MTVQMGPNGSTLNVARTQLEISRAIQPAVANPGTVKGLIVGNESFGVNGVRVGDMVSLMSSAKTTRDAAGFTAVPMPISGMVGAVGLRLRRK